METGKQDKADRDQTNKRLVFKTLAGDNEAFTELIEAHYKLFYSLALSYVHDFDEAKDIVQDGLITIHEKLDTLRDPAQFVSWAYTIVRRKASLALKKEKREKTGISQYTERQKLDAEISKSAMDSVSSRSQNEAVVKATAQLPERYREMIVLYYIEQKDILEISQILGLTITTANVHLFRARHRLKEILKGNL